MKGFEFFVYDEVWAADLPLTVGSIGFGPTVKGTTGFVAAMKNAGTISESTMQAAFTPVTNFTKFAYEGY